MSKATAKGTTKAVREGVARAPAGRVPAEKKARLAHRLNRVVGQIQAVKTMIDQDRACLDIAQQLSAARSALDKAYFEMMSCAIEQSVKDGVDRGEGWQRELEELTQTLAKYA